MIKTIRKTAWLFVLLGVLWLAWGTVPALAVDFSAAVPIALNAGVTAYTTAGSKDQELVYRIELSKRGAIRVELEHARQANSDDYWDVRIYNSAAQELLAAGIPGNTVRAELPELGINAGTYYMVISSSEYESAASTDPLTVTVRYVDSAYYEKELNESFSAATPMILNQAYMGATLWGSRYACDYYVFEAKSNGAVRLKFQHELLESDGTFWQVEILDSDSNVLCSRYIFGNSESYTLPGIGVAAGTYYVRVTSTGYEKPASTSTYAITVGFTASEQWEKEPNDTFLLATPIVVDAIYTGTACRGYRYGHDYYLFEAPSSGVYKLLFSSAQSDSTEDLYRVSVFDAAYKQITTYTLPGSGSTHTKEFRIGSAGQYYVAVESCGYNETACEAEYSFRVVDPDTETESEAFSGKVSGNGFTFKLDGKTLTATVLSVSGLSEVAIPSGLNYKGNSYKVTAIANKAMRKNSEIVSVTIGTNITTIGKMAFANCTNLKTVKMNSKVIKIQAGAFYKCTALKTIKLPASLKKIGEKAFKYCSSLKKMTVYTTMLTSARVGAQAFKKTYKKMVVKTKKAVREAYTELFLARGLSKYATFK